MKMAQEEGDGNEELRAACRKPPGSLCHPCTNP
jgi:hypothetical protein